MGQLQNIINIVSLPSSSVAPYKHNSLLTPNYWVLAYTYEGTSYLREKSAVVRAVNKPFMIW